MFMYGGKLVVVQGSLWFLIGGIALLCSSKRVAIGYL